MTNHKGSEGRTELAPREANTIVLPSGRALDVASSGDEDVVRIRSKAGACVLTIHLTDEGPVVRVEGASLEVAAAKKLSLACEDFSLRATKGATIEVGGKLDARAGAIDLSANDDVSLHGERVLLNSDDPPMPLTWEEYEARHGTITQKALPAAAELRDDAAGKDA